MNNSSTTLAVPSNKQVIGHLGLKRSQWKMRTSWQIVARNFLEGKGFDVVRINCFLKTGKLGKKPPNVSNKVNIIIRLNGSNSLEIAV